MLSKHAAKRMTSRKAPEIDLSAGIEKLSKHTKGQGAIFSGGFAYIVNVEPQRLITILKVQSGTTISNIEAAVFL